MASKKHVLFLADSDCDMLSREDSLDNLDYEYLDKIADKTETIRERVEKNNRWNAFVLTVVLALCLFGVYAFIVFR